MHKTAAGEKRKALKTEAMELERYARAAMRAAEILPDARREARELESQADELKAESGPLVGAARLEDITVWEDYIVKQTKKGEKKYGRWLAGRRQSPQGLPGILQEAEPVRGPAKGQGDEGRGPGDLSQ